MREHQLRLAVIVGSTREGRFGDKVAAWFASEASAREDMEVDLIDLADVKIPAVFPGRPVAHIADYVERIDRADAFVIVTPEYNHGYPASLKQAIDITHGWKAKPVGFVSYGGMAGGLRSVEQLRQVFAELHAVTVRDTVSFHNFFRLFDESGDPIDRQGCDAAAKVMLDQLAWWGRALAEAREARPYAA